MDHVKEWATAVSCACLLGAMLSMAFPNGSSKRILGIIISLMAMCIMFKPMASLADRMADLKSYSFDVSQYENSELNTEVQQEAKSIYSSYLEENIRRVLDGANISYQSVDVMMDISADGCISIGQVEVIVKNEDVDMTDRIKELLRGYIGFEPAVRAGDQKGSESSD